MKKLIVALVAGALMSTTSGCSPKLIEGDTLFTITARHGLFFGATLEEAELEIPIDAEIIDFTHVRGPIFGIIQYTYIKGTK